MKNKETKNEYQDKLFKLIKSKLPANVSEIDKVSELLDVEHDAIYRRKRGDKLMSFKEVLLLCDEYNISIDELSCIRSSKDKIVCDYLNSPNIYVAATQLAEVEDVEEIKKSECKILLSAFDIPIFHIASDKELFLFKLFSCKKRYTENDDTYTGSFEEYVKELGNIELLKTIHEKIDKSYESIPSSEIWTEITVDTYLNLLNYHFDMGHFNDKEYPLLICEQLINLMDKLQNWATKGVKGTGKKQFKFYVNEFETVNTFVIFKTPQKTQCIIRLHPFNGLSTSDESFCKETEAWFYSSIQRATQISETSEKERSKFFNTQKQKIEALSKKIENTGK